jgi:hypothetical protein
MCVGLTVRTSAKHSFAPGAPRTTGCRRLPTSKQRVRLGGSQFSRRANEASAPRFRRNPEMRGHCSRLHGGNEPEIMPIAEHWRANP